MTATAQSGEDLRRAGAEPRQAVLIVNPLAGGVAGRADTITDLEAAIRAAGFMLAAAPRPELGIDAQIAHALSLAPDVMFVMGGDGTMRAAASHMMHGDAALAVLPGGTMNRLAAQLGLPADPQQAARRLASAGTEAMAMGEVNGQPFLYQAVVGRVSRLARFREMQRGTGLLGWLPLMRAALRQMLRRPARSLRLRAGGRRQSADIVVVTAPPPGGAPLMRIEAVRRRGPAAALGQAWWWMRGRLAEAPEVTAIERRHLVVGGHSERLRVTLDGELHLMEAPLRFRLRPDALRVLRPARE